MTDAPTGGEFLRMQDLQSSKSRKHHHGGGGQNKLLEASSQSELSHASHP